MGAAEVSVVGAPKFTCSACAILASCSGVAVGSGASIGAVLEALVEVLDVLGLGADATCDWMLRNAGALSAERGCHRRLCTVVLAGAAVFGGAEAGVCVCGAEASTAAFLGVELAGVVGADGVSAGVAIVELDFGGVLGVGCAGAMV